MHPTTDDMLALLDGDANAECTEHVNRCVRCSGELVELEEIRAALRGLPQLQPPRGGWEAMRTSAQHRRSLHRRLRLAAAAAVVAVGVAMWLGVGSVDVFRSEARSQRFESADLDALIEASGQLERALHVPALSTRVMTPQEAARIVMIEDGIALIDLQLARTVEGSPSARDVELWSDRIELLDALVQARGAIPFLRTARNAHFDEERSWQ